MLYHREIPTPAGKIYTMSDEESLKFCRFSPTEHSLFSNEGNYISGRLHEFMTMYFKKEKVTLLLNLMKDDRSSHHRVHYFTGKEKPAKEISLTLDMSAYSGNEFKIYEALLSVPYGATISYGELAMLAGIPRGGRFAGNTMGRNGFPIIIPCHRVIKADGKPGRYTSGDERKIVLLRHENPHRWPL